MKGLQIAVLLLVLSISTIKASPVTASESSLQCNFCLANNENECTNKVEECEDPLDVCATVSFPDSFTKGCLSDEGLQQLKTYEDIKLTTCDSDLCN